MKGSYIPQGALTLGLIVGLNSQGWSQSQQPAAQQYDIGQLEYQASCASCHGIDGKGTGPVAPSLNKKPADLTMLAKQNSGVFPVGRIYDTIDGRLEVKSHGTREMPIFGFRFSPAPIPGFSPQAPYYVDPLYDREPIIRTRILAVNRLPLPYPRKIAKGLPNRGAAQGSERFNQPINASGSCACTLVAAAGSAGSWSTVAS